MKQKEPSHGTLAQNSSLFAHLAAVAIAALVIAGCNSGGPKMSGFAIGSTRIVSVGEVVELRMPLQESGDRQWRVSSYNSLYISMAGRPRVEVSSNGTREMIVTARARTPGDTEIELTEIATRSTKPKVVRFKVKIRE